MRAGGPGRAARCDRRSRRPATDRTGPGQRPASRTEGGSAPARAPPRQSSSTWPPPEATSPATVYRRAPWRSKREHGTGSANGKAANGARRSHGVPRRWRDEEAEAGEGGTACAGRGARVARRGARPAMPAPPLRRSRFAVAGRRSSGVSDGRAPAPPTPTGEAIHASR